MALLLQLDILSWSKEAFSFLTPKQPANPCIYFGMGSKSLRLNVLLSLYKWNCVTISPACSKFLEFWTLYCLEQGLNNIYVQCIFTCQSENILWCSLDELLQLWIFYDTVSMLHFTYSNIYSSWNLAVQAYWVILSRCLKILILKLLGKREKWVNQKVHECVLILDAGYLLTKHVLIGLLCL